MDLSEDGLQTGWVDEWMNKDVLKYLDLTWMQILRNYELRCLILVFLYYNWILINSNPDSYPGFRLRISAQVLGVLPQIIHGFAALTGCWWDGIGIFTNANSASFRILSSSFTTNTYFRRCTHSCLNKSSGFFQSFCSLYHRLFETVFAFI